MASPPESRTQGWEGHLGALLNHGQVRPLTGWSKQGPRRPPPARRHAPVRRRRVPGVRAVLLAGRCGRHVAGFGARVVAYRLHDQRHLGKLLEQRAVAAPTVRPIAVEGPAPQ